MPTSDIYKEPVGDGDLGGPGNSGNSSNLPTNSILLSPIRFSGKVDACAFLPVDAGYSEKLAYQDAKALTFNNTIYEFSINIKQKFNGGNKWWALAHTPSAFLIGASRALQISTTGVIIGVYNCDTDNDDDGDDIIIDDNTPPTKTVIPSPVSGLIYNYFVLENLSRSKKIFAYYSGSQNFNYTFSTDTTSTDPGSGFFRLNQGPEGTGGNEDAATEMYIDIKDNQGKEDIITYLTSLSSSLAKTGTPETPYGEVQLYISGSGADQYYHRFDLQNVTFEGSTPAIDGYFKLDIASSGSDPGSNPLSSSIAAGSGSNVQVKFFNDIIPGYHETEVTSLDKDYVIACVTQTASYGSGSISQPFTISWGMPENEFLNSDFYPTQPGYAWLWNDGYKVKHIKINNQSFGGDRLTDFVKKSDWSRFVLYNPFNAQGNLLHTADGNYPETFYLHNVTKYKPYTHLFVNQENRDTTFAVDSQNFASTNHNFLAEGKYIIDAKASGTVVEPVITTNISESLPQGYFPSASSNYPQEQFFRGWADANYYSNGTLVGTGGDYSDPLRQFETGSTERDYDAAPAYLKSQIPFFINATSSYIPIPSSDFGTYSSQPNTIRVGPGLKTTGGDVLSYYYEETTGKILISGAEHLDTKKTENYIFNNLYDTELVAPSNETTTYITPDLSYIIEVKPSQSLWLTRGRDAANAGDTDRYKYNRYLHRPYKAYVLLGTGSTDAGYGGDEYSLGVYGEGTVPVGPPVNEAVQIFMHYSQSSANLRSDGIYTFDTLLSEDVGLTASVDLSYRSDTYIPPTIYGQSEYGDNNSEYGGAGSGTDILTWRTASLNIYKNSSILASETIYLEPADIEAGSTLTIKYPLTQNEIATGDTLRLALEVDTTDTQAFNAALVATSYTMSIGGTVPPTDDKVPVTFNNYLELNDDCNPLVSNIVIDRPNPRLQDVDYSSPISGSLYPVNFEQIIRDEAVRATVPESNYTKLSSINPRYVGSKSISQKYNLFTEGDEGTFGKVSNIDINKAYFGYFNKIYDLYPLLEGTTTLDIKYIFDANGNRFNPRLGSYNYYNLEGTFEDGSTLTLSTNVKEDESLILLNTDHKVKHVGVLPTPILYTQTGGREYTGSISFTGVKPPQPEPPTFNDYSFRASSSATSPSETRNFAGVNRYDISVDSTTNLNQLSPDFAVSGSEDNVTSSYDPGTGTITFPTDDNLAPDGPGDNKPLSDNYSFSLEHTFETTPIGKQLTDDRSGTFQFGPERFNENRVGNYYLRALVDGRMADLIVDDIVLEFIHTNPNASSGISSHNVSYKTKFSRNVHFFNGYVRIDFHRNDIKSYMDSNGISRNISNVLDGNGGNHSGTWVKCRWTIKAKVKPRSSGLFQLPYFKQGDNIKISTGGYFGPNEAGGRFQNYFFPDTSPYDSVQFDRYILSNTKSNPPQGAQFPFWEVVANTSGSILEMQSDKVNEAYNTALKQVDIPYIPTTWPKFPFNQEPSFVTFPNVTKFWNLELNDEIKFENNESKVYKIIDISPPEESGKLRVTISPPIDDFTTNFDFFVVRRFIEEKGTIILDTPKPYTPSISGSVTTVVPSTSPGIILPEFPVEEINIDPNLIVKDLEDKKLIE